jgi:hypothetical protein
MSQIVNLDELRKDPKKLQEVGSDIVSRALRAALEERMLLEPSYYPNVRGVKPGDPIPPDLVGKIPARPDGTAAKDWGDAGWTDIGIWERSTWEKTAAIPNLAKLKGLPALEQLKYLSKLNPQELDILKKLGIMD